MKVDLRVTRDFPLFGEERKTGAVLGTIEVPDAAKPITVSSKLKNAIAGGNLAFEIQQAPEAKRAEPKKPAGASVGKEAAAGTGKS